MNRLGAAGFPTFALERDGRLQVLDTGRYLGQPDDWRAFLETQLRLAGGSGAVGGPRRRLPHRRLRLNPAAAQAD